MLTHENIKHREKGEMEERSCGEESNIREKLGLFSGSIGLSVEYSYYGLSQHTIFMGNERDTGFIPPYFDDDSIPARRLHKCLMSSASEWPRILNTGVKCCTLSNNHRIECTNVLLLLSGRVFRPRCQKPPESP